jgi:hypothetical protein
MRNNASSSGQVVNDDASPNFVQSSNDELRFVGHGIGHVKAPVNGTAGAHARQLHLD